MIYKCLYILAWQGNMAINRIIIVVYFYIIYGWIPKLQKKFKLFCDTI